MLAHKIVGLIFFVKEEGQSPLPKWMEGPCPDNPSGSAASIMTLYIARSYHNRFVHSREFVRHEIMISKQWTLQQLQETLLRLRCFNRESTAMSR